MIFKKSIVLSCAAMLLVFFECKKHTSKNVEQNLEYVSSFGSFPADGYIASARSLDIDTHIYVADLGTAKIHQFNLDGEFIKSFGREGRGPGEFSRNINVSAKNDSLFVTDFSNLNVTIFKASGEYVDTFYLNRRHNLEFQKIGDSFVAGHTISHPFELDYSDQDLLYIYNQEGKIINSFGDFIQNNGDVPSIMQRNFTDISNERIHVVFFYFPVYRIYNIQGSLLAEFKIDSLIAFPDTAINNNIQVNDGLDRSVIADIKGNLGGIQVYGEKVFIPVYDESFHRIDEFELLNNNLIHIKTYRYPLKSNDRTVVGYLDFVYSHERSSFYILENVQDQGVLVTEYKFQNS